MRKYFTFYFLMSSFFLNAQNTLNDTIFIPEVFIEAEEIKSQSVQKLDSTILHNSIQKNLGEVLAQSSNVFVKSYGVGSQATVSLRGSGSSHTNVFWNGVALNSSMNGLVDMALFPTLFLDDVAVNYGNSSLQTGSGGIGGAIQLENKVDFKPKSKSTLQQHFGSFGYQTSTLKNETGNDKIQSVSRLFYRSSNNNFSYEDLGEEGFPTKKVENAALAQKSFMQSVYYRLKEKHLVEAHFWYYDSDRNLPPMITLKNINENQKDESLRLILKMKNYFKDGHYSISLSSINDKLTYENNLLLRGIKTETNSYKSWGELEKNWKKTTFYSRVNADIEQAIHPSFTTKIQRERVSIYSSVNRQMTSKLVAEFAARQEWILEEDNFFLPLVSLGYTLNKNLLISIQASKNIKYPSLNDLYWEYGGNSNLKAEENQSVESGFVYKGNKKNKHLKYELSGTAYYSEIDNYIQWRPTPFGFWQAINLRNVKIKGIESSLKLIQKKTILEKQLRLNYTYTQSLNQGKLHRFDDSDNKQLIYIPEHQFNTYTSLKYKSYQLFYQWQFISARYTTTDNTEWQPHYQLSNIGLNKQFKNKRHTLNAEFSILNIFDIEYYAIQWRPMPNRNYQLSLTYQFN